MQTLALEAGNRYGAGRGWSRWQRRPAIALAVAALALAVAGDRSRAAGVPPSVAGQDPLEVLELKIRPNVFVVLDSSGSMTNWVQDESNSMNSGDHPRSKLNEAKVVLRAMVQNNQDKVSFQFGTYTQFASNNVSYQGAGANRFQYVASGANFAFMNTAATELTVRGALGDTTLTRGLQSWQLMYPAWGTLYFEEDADAAGSVDAAVCRATLTGLPKFYARGGSGAVSPALSTSTTPQNLSFDLQTAMNTATCASGTRQNTYSVTYNTGSGVFTIARNAGTRQWRILWGQAPNNIRNSLAKTSTATTAWTTTGTQTTNAPWTLLFRQTGTGSSGTGLNTDWTFTETIAGTPTKFYQLRAGRFWNGEVLRVLSTGEVCGMDFPTAATKTVPASVTVAAADASCNPTGDSAKFDWAGGSFTGNSISCNGYRSKSQLIPCDLKMPPAPLQFTTIGPYLDNELPLDANGDPADWSGDGTPDYTESQDGGWAVASVNVAPSAHASGSTPIANSLIDIKGTANASDTSCVTNAEAIYPTLDLNSAAATTGACQERNFTKMWNTGPTAGGMSPTLGTGPWNSVPAAQRAIKNHNNPKERSIVLFVTDGLDTCGSRSGSLASSTFSTEGPGATADNQRARRAAYYAQLLYTPIVATEPASSVQTYAIGFGGGLNPPDLLNWIAWGGSGLGQNQPGQPAVNWQTDTSTNLAIARSRCTTCTDAFIAPDPAALATQLQSIIDQGASSGEFNAQQSITESVFEYVHVAPPTGSTVYDAAKPSNRYKAIVPTRIIASFTLPGFKGQQKAYQNDGAGNALLKWSAGDVLFNQISPAMATCGGTGGAATGECVFDQLIGGSTATDANIRTSGAKIKRRIYTTTGNGVYPYTIDTLIDGTSTARATLWPPVAGLTATNSTTDDSVKAYDVAFGLPPDSPTSFPPNPVDPKCDPNDNRLIVALPKKAYDECWFGWLQTKFQACQGNNLSANCTAATFATKMKAARREAREISIAFLAGATTVPAVAGAGIKRTTGAIGSAPVGSLLYKARDWMLGDSEFATDAVVTQPLPVDPKVFIDEYKLYRDGPTGSGAKPDSASSMIKMGFGLTNPDNDGSVAANVADTGRPNLKPVMTVVYAPANDMLHAFRAGPCRTPALSSVACNDAGGEELWGFVPYDQLHTVVLRPAFQPQGKANHVYSMARGARFADVFVPGSYSRTAGGLTIASTNGAWRRILYIGRGAGGKYVTALDVTGPGAYTSFALDATPPVPLWSRGNPDTDTGLAAGNPNGSGGDTLAYSKMGETWSIPTVGFVDNTNPIYFSSRRRAAVDHVLFLGSGYGVTSGCPLAPCEGQTFYTLDALTGDVLAAADVGSRNNPPSYPNALVANAVGFQPDVFSLLTTTHPSSNFVTRVYIGDVHGRLWKFLTKDPSQALLAADLGADQPIGVASSLLGLPPKPSVPVPYILVNSGADRRATGPFRIYNFRDDGAEDDFAIGGASTDGLGTITYAPVVEMFSRTYDQGIPDANCGYTVQAFFRGTVQPAAAFECTGGIAAGSCLNPIGRAFYAGTRLSLPNTIFAPITPLACGSGVYPCRSQFDSIIYALGAETGQPAYDLNSGAADDAYRIFRDSRIAAITMQADPDPTRGGSSFTPDEGLMKGTPKPPPPPGVPPSTRTNSHNVVMAREPGQPAPNVRYGSTVCQQ